MASPQPLKLELFLRSDNPDVLVGLDQWVRLGLISETQVMRLAQQMTCPLPVQVAAAPIDASEVLRRRLNPARDFANATDFTEQPALAPRNRSEQPSNFLDAFMAELSVLWLLLLGLFLVVVSSAVLAFSQWENFSPVGQYGILFAYTLAFGLAGHLCSNKPKLQLTGQMLNMTTLLLIPVNFWMIDGFKLLRSPLGIIVALVAGLGLSVLNGYLLRGSDRLTRLNGLVLPWLHLGWGMPSVALGMSYLGTVGTATLQASKAQPIQPIQRPVAIALIFSTLLLMVRALGKGIAIGQFGLALAISGGVLCWLNRREMRSLWQLGGGGLILLGWIVSLLPSAGFIIRGIDPLWQVMAVSAIALVLLGSRLKRFGETVALVGFWTVGLQTYAVSRVLFPPGMRRSIISQVAAWADLQSGAWELTGLGFFGYILMTLVGAAYLRRKQLASLADLSEVLALGLGAVLAIPSMVNPLVRAIYLTLSAIVLGIVLWQRRSQFRDWSDYSVTGLGLVFQSTVVVAGLSWCYWLFPHWNGLQWAWVFLLLTMVAWGVSLLSRDRFWQRSSWFVGLAQASCAYLLFSSEIRSNMTMVALPWLVVPAALTGLGYRTEGSRSRLNLALAMGAMVFGSGLAIWSSSAWVVAAMVGVGVMGLVSWKWPVWPVAGLTLSYGLSALLVPFWYSSYEAEPQNWMLLMVGITWGLWLLRWGSNRLRNPLLGEAYSMAADGLGWGFAVLATVSMFFAGDQWFAFAGLMGALVCRQGLEPNLWGLGMFSLGLARLLLGLLPDGGDVWAGAVAGVVAIAIDFLPGVGDWRRSSWLLPAIVVLVTAPVIAVTPLLLAGASYGFLALKNQRVGLSYVGLALADWGIWQWLGLRSISDPLWYVAVFSASLIYVSHVEQTLQANNQRELRHWLRVLALGLFAFTAFAEIGAVSWNQGLFTILLGLGMGALGILLRTRAYLYVGTVTFVMAVLRQSWVFVSNYSMLLWVLGIGLGVVLIWAAATFEARRAQTIALVKYWVGELDRWA
jgi:hypothetical protein